MTKSVKFRRNTSKQTKTLISHLTSHISSHATHAFVSASLFPFWLEYK